MFKRSHKIACKAPKHSTAKHTSAFKHTPKNNTFNLTMRRNVHSTPAEPSMNPSTTTTDVSAQQKTQPEIKLRPDVRHDFVNAISDEMLVTLSMNFNNSGRTHAELCDNLKKNSLISTPLIEYAFRKCDRKFFDPSLHPYEDKPHEIGGGATISAAHMHAISLESLGDSVVPVKAKEAIPVKTFLDVGSGSGFVTAVFGTIINALRVNQLHRDNALKSKAFGIEIHPGLSRQSISNIQHCNRELFDDGIVEMINCDAFSLKTPLKQGPFDAIHCGVGIDFVPLSLLAQLKHGGRLVIPICLPGSHEQDLYLFSRKNVIDNALLAENDDIFERACQLQVEGDKTKITEFLDTFFTRTPLLRCLFLMAHTDKTVPSNMPAINTAEKQKQNQVLAGFFNKDESKMTAEQLEQSALALNAYKDAEKQAKLRQYNDELKERQAELDQMSEQVKAWHVDWVAKNDGKKPSLAIMQSDKTLSHSLVIIKELRVRISKLERAIMTLQTADAEKPKKH